MKRVCPTIHELLAFDAVVRHGSFSQAAGSLCITVSAVSKQIAGLENFLGRALFHKSGRSVNLTPQGQVYWQKISSSLRAIEAASFELRAAGSGAGILTLASVPTFLTKWLIPRLPSFSAQCPRVILSFSQHLGNQEDLPDGVDAAIRYGDGNWPGIASDYLAGREFVLVGASDLLKTVRLDQAEDVARFTLLHHEHAQGAWRQWAVQHGVAERLVLSGPRFVQYSALIQAAVSGLGLGLVPKVLVLGELAAASLHMPMGQSVQVDQGHYLCFRSEALSSPSFSAFRSWILTEARKTVEPV
jgi:LysR family transcriptional regulator, glycine cleavage system transcriptional activator